MQNLPLFSSNPDDDFLDTGELPPEDEPSHYTVSELATYIRLKFEMDRQLSGVWVEGEVSNLTRAASGHLYFTIKDANAQLKCVMWKGNVARLQQFPEHGDQVIVLGNVGIYEQRSEYQLVAQVIQMAGLGDLNQQLELLKAKLTAEGLFDETRKRPLPFFPRRIGVVTSPTTAAFQDVLKVLGRRFPVAEIILSPTMVQGEQAPLQIIAALDRINRREDIDVILLVRGGGSLEDLWCFNDEQVVRAVAASRWPIVTGVGHEIDFTLVDFASDRRAPTPSAAAEMITPQIDILRDSVEILWERAQNAMQNHLDELQDDLGAYERSLRHLSPYVRIQNYRQRVDDLTMRLQRGMVGNLNSARQRLNTQETALRANSPLAILSRGYAIVTRAGDGKRLSNAQDAAPGVDVVIQLDKGSLRAAVKSRELGD
ncbi:MAG: exodeoxyribonuclease VII large subunit [Chloroflexi bacterium]|nr:exodeoxyribonuclease VII large subunit [Chloroflexota bacterium]